MNHQDWEPVIFKKSEQQLVKEKKRQPTTVRNGTGGTNTVVQNIKTNEFDEPVKKKPDTFSSKLIQQKRLEKKISRKDLASKCNIKESLLADYEKGKIPIPGNHKISICKHLGISSLKKKK